ncbi:MAG: alpha/beta hydrolase [Burkholderiaceae bacterium]
MNSVEIDGTRLEVASIAASEGAEQRAPIVFLHEGLGSVAMWRDWPQQVCQATGRGGWVYSRRGYGGSEPVPHKHRATSPVRGLRRGHLAPDYLHHEALVVLPALLLKLGIDAPILLGHSDGGSIALIHASFFPLAGCVVMAPHVMVEDVSVRSIEAARQAFEDGDLRQRLQRYHDDVDGAFWQWNDIWLDPAFRSFDIRADCTRISAPVLAIQGREDPYGSLAQIDEIDLPPGQLSRVVVESCGHSPQRDQPDTATRLVTEFMASLP